MSYVELFGIIATIILVVSMCYNCKSRKSTLIMRGLNALSAVLFIIYSIILCAYSSILSNLAILIIDIYYIIKTYRKS